MEFKIPYFSWTPLTVKVPIEDKKEGTVEATLDPCQLKKFGLLTVTTVATIVHPLLGLATYVVGNCLGNYHSVKHLKEMQKKYPKKAPTPEFVKKDPENPPLRTKKCIERLDKELVEQNLMRGNAIDNGDCFYDAFSQALEETTGTKTTVEQLRKDVEEETKVFTGIKDNWIEVQLKKCSLCTYEEFLETVSISFAKNPNKARVWGRPSIDGQILCRKYGVSLKMHGVGVLSLPEDVKEKEDRDKFYEDPKNYYTDETDSFINSKATKTIHMSVYPGHFEPAFEVPSPEENVNQLTSDLELIRLSKFIEYVKRNRRAYKILMIASMVFSGIATAVCVAAIYSAASKIVIGSSALGIIAFAVYALYMKRCIFHMDVYLKIFEHFSEGRFKEAKDILEPLLKAIRHQKEMEEAKADISNALNKTSQKEDEKPSVKKHDSYHKYLNISEFNSIFHPACSTIEERSILFFSRLETIYLTCATQLANNPENISKDAYVPKEQTDYPKAVELITGKLQTFKHASIRIFKRIHTGYGLLIHKINKRYHNTDINNTASHLSLNDEFWKKSIEPLLENGRREEGIKAINLLWPKFVAYA